MPASRRIYRPAARHIGLHPVVRRQHAGCRQGVVGGAGGDGTRRRGQIAVNASTAGYGGLPKAAAYGASKAAAIHMCQALKFDCDKLGIRLQVVNPGFIDTPLTRKNEFPMPFLVTEDAAAKRTRRVRAGRLRDHLPARDSPGSSRRSTFCPIRPISGSSPARTGWHKVPPAELGADIKS